LERATGMAFRARSLENIYNYLAVDEFLTTSGQPDAGELALIAAANYKTVINLAPQSVLENSLKSEAQLVSELGLQYVHIPVDFKQPTKADFEQFVAAMNQCDDDKVWVHCAANMRVSAFIYCYRVLHCGEAEEQAAARLASIWTPFGVWRKFVASLAFHR
ncbi:MAG: protein tyrosine phosphatase family protein, partial [Pseudomonadota bacterium]